MGKGRRDEAARRAGVGLLAWTWLVGLAAPAASTHLCPCGPKPPCCPPADAGRPMHGGSHGAAHPTHAQAHHAAHTRAAAVDHDAPRAHRGDDPAHRERARPPCRHHDAGHGPAGAKPARSLYASVSGGAAESAHHLHAPNACDCPTVAADGAPFRLGNLGERNTLRSPESGVDRSVAAFRAAGAIPSAARLQGGLGLEHGPAPPRGLRFLRTVVLLI